MSMRIRLDSYKKLSLGTVANAVMFSDKYVD
jgi:hypothetical protein